MKLRTCYFLLFLAGLWAMPAHTIHSQQAVISRFINQPWQSDKRADYHFKAHRPVVADDACDQALDEASTRNPSTTPALDQRVPTLMIHRWPASSDAQTHTIRTSHPPRYILFSSYLI